MSTSNTTTGAVLGATTFGGLVSTLLDWRCAIVAGLLILLLGLLILLLKKRDKDEENRKAKQVPVESAV
jgi:predicted MFS family arabinose efflux permease